MHFHVSLMYVNTISFSWWSGKQEFDESNFERSFNAKCVKKERNKQTNKQTNKQKDLMITAGIRNIPRAITFIVAKVNILVPKCGTYNFYYLYISWHTDGDRSYVVRCYALFGTFSTKCCKLICLFSLCLSVCVSVSLTTREPLNCFNYI
jgi:hypothetical protein